MRKASREMDVTELHDEENLLVQMQDRWENYGKDPFHLQHALTVEGVMRWYKRQDFLVVVFVHYVLDETHTSALRSIFGIES